LHSFSDRFGHVRYYFRYRGNRWALPGPHEAGFATAYDALLTQIKANPLALKNNIAFMRGSLGWVIDFDGIRGARRSHEAKLSPRY
jgi:hypothetical protein